ncbi:predicted protein [Sclerotinia sclerotiorum 1980 UF-70]|uniref:Uncharacterized protein n=1 Tax=Sclerotinia sclerotiorum (strain ATCC 18683 / 1980 / Ss-1) TaxID=665079 RepID=A7E7N4_SCLS1|nr:predicted protein [Sclerotinia sclerotiorum 1980 UF-70]EDN96386.1 predicted protein [Sclerotinia sclerotiorum 1980 UF-70]
MSAFLLEVLCHISELVKGTGAEVSTGIIETFATAEKQLRRFKIDNNETELLERTLCEGKIKCIEDENDLELNKTRYWTELLLRNFRPKAILA